MRNKPLPDHKRSESFNKLYTFKHNILRQDDSQLDPMAVIVRENPNPVADPSHIPDSVFEKLQRETLEKTKLVMAHKEEKKEQEKKIKEEKLKIEANRQAKEE